MPNPFVNTPGEMNQSKEPTEIDPDAPVMEEYAGENNPYRGIEPHGVKPTDDPTNVPEWREDGRMAPVNYVPDAPDIEPIPVRIVVEGREEIKKWRNGTYLVTDIPQQIVNRDRTRTRLRIRNRSGSLGIFIGNDSNVSADFGYLISSNTTFEMNTTEEVWAVCSPGLTVDINILHEFVVEIP